MPGAYARPLAHGNSHAADILKEALLKAAKVLLATD